MLKAVSAPNSADISDEYKVYARQDSGEWLQLSVYRALCPTTQKSFEVTYFTSFDFEGTVEIKAEYSKYADNFKLKPETYNISFNKNDNCVTFTVNSEDNFKFITLEPDGNVFECLHIFANKPFEFFPFCKNLIHFEKGIYDESNCEYITLDKYGNPVIENIPDDTYICLDDGAVVKASIILSGVKNVKIDGRGIISQLNRCVDYENDFSSPNKSAAFRENAMPAVYIKSGCSDIIVNGITVVAEFRDITVRNSDRIEINNVKLFSHTQNADGINCINASDIVVKDSFIHSADDCICMYTSYDSIPFLNDEGYEPHAPLSQRYDISGCVLWTVCRPFVFGGHARNNKIHRDIVSDIHVSDCEIIDVPYCLHSSNGVKYWSGYFRVLSQSEAIVKDILFENINAGFTDGYLSQPFHIEVRNCADASYSESGGYRIENVAFRNINFYNCSTENTVPSLFKAPEGTGDYAVDGVYFENITFNGKNLSEFNDAMLLKEGNIKNIFVE